jgi:lipopolysaccharide transport system ATP-binding protein
MTRVKLDGVGKAYQLYRRPHDRLKDLLLGTASYDLHWALKDVSVVLGKGDSLGVIGNNGAGKSTLMKVVTGVLAPSAGTVDVSGRVTAILELGTGFHPEFTGRENVLYSADVLGIPRQEIRERFDQILAFSELGQAIDEPTKTYSTGMVMRLGFALVTSVAPDVLVVDEALAVGDQRFKQKCIERLAEIKASGTTILFCSHSMHHVTHFCDRALWLDHGRVVTLGPAREVVDRYVAANTAPQAAVQQTHSTSPRKAPPPRARCTVTDLVPLDGAALTRGDALRVAVEFTVQVPGRYVFGVAIDREETGQRFVAETAAECGLPPVELASGPHKVVMRIGTGALRHGRYLVKAGLLDDSLLQIEDYRILEIEVNDPDPIRSPSLIRVPVQWDVEGRYYGQDSR